MNADSAKARLKNEAIQSGKTFQDALTYYGLERTIYRISISEYKEHFILKGGIFLYAIYDKHYERATTDVDLLARRISNSSEEMKSVFRDILSIETDDALTYDLDSLVVENITEFKEYHGLHIQVTAYLDRTRIPVGIDIGFGDVVYPEPVKMEFPTLLDDMPIPVVNGYSLETSVAEKFEAIIHNGYLNSRYKDFYDIYVISRTHSFAFPTLREAVAETFSNRKTDLTMETAAFGEEFLSDPMHQSRWKSFLKKKKAMIQVSMGDALSGVKTFLKPLVDGGLSEDATWNPEKGKWE